MSLLVAGLLVLVGLWLAWKVVKFTAKLALIGGVVAVVYFVLLPRIEAFL